MSRTAALLTLGFLGAALAPSDGVAGRIYLFADPYPSLCEVVDAGPGTVNVYVFHVPSSAVPAFSGSAFKLGSSEGFTGVFQSVEYPGDLFAYGDIVGGGVAVGYFLCRFESFLIATVTYTTFGTSADCSSIMVLPYDESGIVEVVSCDGGATPALVAGRMVVNPTFSCWDECGLSVPTRETTWGAVKALYR
jgi:hypothetical protein